MPSKKTITIINSLNPQNRKLITAFEDATDFVDTSKPVSEGRKYRRTRVMANLAIHANKDLDKIKQNDLKNYIFSIENQHSKRNNAAIIKSFYRGDLQVFIDLLKEIKVASHQSRGTG